MFQEPQKISTYNSKNYELKIAYSNKLDDSKNILYSFFRTNVKFPFPALIHGTFDLGENRNSLNKSDENNFLIGELIQLMIETAIEITKSSKPSWNALKLLICGEFDDPVLKEFNFNQKLKEQIKKNKLFPTISNNYISLTENPIFFKNQFSDIIPSKYLPNLTIWTIEKEIVSYIKNELNGLYKISTGEFFEKVSDLSKNGNINLFQRSKLIKYIHSEFETELILNQYKLELFIDDKNNIISSLSTKFIPSARIEISVPDYVNLRLINNNLIDYLKQDFNETENDDLASKLKYFNVKRYRFDDIIKQIVDETRLVLNIQNKIEILSKLNNCLFANYLKYSNIDRPYVSFVEIPVLNKNDEIIYVSKYKKEKLYFGNEYDNEIIERLFNTKKHLFLCSPNQLKLKKDNNLKDFFKWLGVSESLSIEEITLTHGEYIDQIKESLKATIKNPFSNTTFGLWIDTIDRIKKDQYIGIRIKSKTINEFQNLLENAEFVDILVWLLRDKNITSVFKPTEIFDPLEIYAGGQRNYRNINKFSYKSYFLWQLQNIKWIKTKTNQKLKISECFISDRIPENLLNYLNKPYFDKNNAIFIKYNISEKEIYDLFNKLGIQNEIKKIPKHLIYNLLFKLPNENEDNKSIKSLYEVIAQNIDNHNLISYEQINFKSKGKLLAEFNKIIDYYDVNTVYYTSKSLYPKNLINKLPILLIDNTFDEKKISDIFCINLLDSVSIEIDGEPQKHKLHNEFNNDFNELKPFIYSYIIENDNENEKLEVLKDLQIILCEIVQTVAIINNNQIKFDMVNYEYINSENTYYIRIDNTYNSILDLKGDFHFRDIISEIITELISNKEKKSHFRELYSSEEKYRHSILKSDLKELAITNLEKSQRLFGRYISHEERFWNIIAAIKNQQATDFKTEKIKSIMENFIFENIIAKSNYSKIIALFKVLGIDINDFNSKSTEYVDLTIYYREIIEKKLQKVSNQIQSKLFQDFADKSIDEKKKFYKKITETPIGINQNSVYFSIDEYIDKFISEIIGYEIKYAQIERFKSVTEYDFDRIYKENLFEFEKKIEHKYKFLLLKLLSNFENKSLIYFGELNELNKIIAEIYKQIYQSKEAKYGNINVDLNGENLVDYTYKDLFNKCLTDNSNYEIDTINISETPTNNKSNKSYSNKKSASVSKNNEVHGFIGESYVYNILKNKYKSVSWVSSNAVKADIISVGDDNLGYDIKYVDENDETQYIEVKSSSKDDFIFNISKAEVDFGEQNSDNYSIMFITNVNQKFRKLYNIQKPFKYKKGENFYHNSKFSVENNNFKIVFEKK